MCLFKHSNFWESILWNIVQPSRFWRLSYLHNSVSSSTTRWRLPPAALWPSAVYSLGRERTLLLSFIINNTNMGCRTRSDQELTRECANLWRQVPQGSTFCTVAPNICGSSVWNLLQVTLLEHRILKLLLCQKTCGTLHVRVVAFGACFWNTVR